MRPILARSMAGLAVLIWVLSLPAQGAGAEKRVAVPLKFGNTTDAVGSLSILGMGSIHGMVMLSTERPGDTMSMALDLSAGLSSPSICLGEGSEVRIGTRLPMGDLTVVPREGVRLCFKRVGGKWVHLCGRGDVEYTKPKRVVKLGADRTVDVCLRMLTSPDAILREGAARDLGRAAAATDAARVIPRLSALLTDPVAGVRRGAAEGLGRLGLDGCMEPLERAAAREKDETTKQFIAEGLALCAGNALIGRSGARHFSGAEAGQLYLQGRTDWADDVLGQRIKAIGRQATDALVGRLESAEAVERLAAVELLGAGDCAAAREVLTKLADQDPDEKVKAAAQKALQGMPR